MVTFRHKVDKNQNDIVELKSLKKDFKRILKKNIYLYEKNELFKIEKLIKLNNSESFFRKVNKQLNNDKENITLDINDLVNHYSNIFNMPLNVTDERNSYVNQEINDLDINNFEPIEINKYDIK
jgi:hypothetical protein